MTRGFSALATHVCDGLRDGKNTAAICSGRERAQACTDALPLLLFDRGMRVHPITCVEAALSALVATIGKDIDGTGPIRSVRELLPTLASIDVVLLTGPDLRLAAMHGELLADWARTQRGLGPADPALRPRLCVVAWGDTSVLGLPETDVNLTHAWAYQFDDSHRDTNERARACSSHLSDPIKREWARRTLEALAGEDAALVDVLAPVSCQPTPSLVDALRADAVTRGWTKDLVELVTTALPGIRQTRVIFGPTEPPAALRRYWAEGLLQWLPASGLEMHSSALAIADRLHQIEHRLWRAQAAWLLPLIDGLRLRVCRYLTDVAPGWHRLVACREEERERLQTNPMHAEFGALLSVLGEGRRARDRDLIGLVSTLKDARNRLAHYQTVELQDLIAIGRHAHAVRDMQEVFP